MSNFLDDCGPIQHREGEGNYMNDQYNQWEENCLKDLIKNRETEYKDKILQWLGHEHSSPQTQQIVMQQSSDNFSTGQTASIGAGAAAGGAGLAFTIPVLGKWLMRFF